MTRRNVQLIVNADDYGVSEEVNEAVIKAFKQGILTSCSLMVTGDACQHAVELARENPRLAVGLHLVTVMGKSVLPHARIPHIVDEQGSFSSNPSVAGLKYYFSTAARHELREELRSQFEKFESTGLKISHIDSHLHMHVHPVIFSAALDLGEQFGVRNMRVPRDELGIAWAFDPGNALKTAALGVIFLLLTRRMRQVLRLRGFKAPERVYGNFLSGRMTEKYALLVLAKLRARTNEIYFHPAEVVRGKSSPDSHQLQCSREFEILVSDRMLERIRECRIRLTNYIDME